MPKRSGSAKSEKVPTIPVHAVVWRDAAYHDEEPPGTTIAVTMGVITEMTDTEVNVTGEVFNDTVGRRHTTIPRGMVLRIIKVATLKLPEFA